MLLKKYLMPLLVALSVGQFSSVSAATPTNHVVKKSSTAAKQTTKNKHKAKSTSKQSLNHHFAKNTQKTTAKSSKKTAVITQHSGVKQSGGRTYKVRGKYYTLMGKEASKYYNEIGLASYYHSKFHGRKTASGEVYNENNYTAAHKTLALGTTVLVTNLNNGRQVTVRVNDRGPFSGVRILDLSKRAAKDLGMLSAGVVKVKVEAIAAGKATKASHQKTTTTKPVKLKMAQHKAIPRENNIVSVGDVSKPVFALKVIQLSQSQAVELSSQIQGAKIVPNGNQYAVVVEHLASQAESVRLKTKLRQMGFYQIFSYSMK